MPSLTWVHACFIPCVLKGLEIQPALPVLSAYCGHAGLSKPKACEARERHNLWRPLPQLHSGASAEPLLPAHLCSRVGTIQRGRHMWRRVHCAYMHSLSLLVSAFLPPCSLAPFVCRLFSDISTPIVHVFTHQMHYPSHLSQAVTSRSSSCVGPSH